MATLRFQQFKVDIRRARDLIGLGQSIGAMTHGLVDASDTFRAAHVQAVAALDHYLHGVVLDRGVEILLGRAAYSQGSTKFSLPINAVSEIAGAQTEADRELAARTYLAQRLSYETFQKPDDVAGALAAVGVPGLFSGAFGSAAANTRTELGLIVQRRNRIVHQCDGDPLNPGSVTPLPDTDAVEAVDFVDHFITTLDGYL